ncbi:3-oxoacyl-[acyl-carrier-protein] synthase-3 [Micromonospora pisi]|uniref:3-oxoacyl-[acyl-carrier-protein] synthase-3 n=1 Tax=Micromonospora pisi TaxID=589240 RepID=A0A495JUU6_9ACTN|nr:ketoacyl-ACP synthase III [Micromonospora pisi]RKR91909.1 3-oxoacyl-[acyl-carrier-protein] synthase-3 [Micromonospora pisi]
MRETAVGILGTGSYLPERKVTNEEIAARVPGVTPEWIERKTLIRVRRYAAEDEATSDLAVRAAVEALDRARTVAAQLDYIIVSTSTGDSPQPPTACLVQNALGAHRAACFDINVVCAGFVYGIALARSLVMAHPGAKVLVVAADVYSRILDFDDRSTAVLLGDGAGAAVVGAVPQRYGILGVDLSTCGEARDLIRVDAGGSRMPSSLETVANGDHLFKMHGRGVRDFVMENVPPAVAGLLARVGTGTAEVDHFVPHQANGVLLGELVQRCGLGGARTWRTLEEYGNVGSASVPVALNDAHRSDSLGDGDLVLLAGFGGGMSMGVCLLRWWSLPAGAAS